MPHRTDTVVRKSGLPENPDDTNEVRIQFNQTAGRFQFNNNGTLGEIPSYEPSAAVVAAGSALTVTKALHNGRTILLDTLTGSVATLPAATGSGARYRFVVSVLATSNSHVVKVANATDIFVGQALVAQDGGDTSVMFDTAADSDTITLNRTTTGSVIRGEVIEVEDIASGIFAVFVRVSATGSEATPFSATV
jgi:hypothetical protein